MGWVRRKGDPLTQARANGILHYNPDTGALTWKINVRRARTGAEAGVLSQGYRRVGFEGRIYLAHRLIWLMVYGVSPRVIDHINRDPSDNRLTNLRAVTQRENLMNVGLRKDNKSGVRGVFLWNGKWRARQRVGTSRVSLGDFPTVEAAAAAIEAAGGHQ